MHRILREPTVLGLHRPFLALVLATVVGGLTLFGGPGGYDRGERAAASSCVPPPSGLISWWPGDGDAQDAANGNHGTLQNGATFGTGLVNQAFSLDGTNDYVLVPHDPSLNPTSAMTIEAWINANTTASARDILSKWGPGGDNQYIFKIHNMSDNQRIELSESGSGHDLADVSGTTSVSTGTWVHLAATFDSTTETVQLYYNGSPDGSLGVGSGRSIHSDTSDLIIGAVSVPSIKENFSGRIDELAVYNRALTGSEIEAIYDAGSAGKCGLGPVGGIAELPDAAEAPLEAPDSSGGNAGLLAGLASAVAAGVLILGGAAWYVRRRLVR